MEKAKRKNSEFRPNIFALIFGVLGTILGSFAKGINWIAKQIGKGLLFVIKQLGHVIAFVFKNGWQIARWILVQPYRLLRYIISGRVPEFENARQEEIFWRIKRQYRRKRLFALNTLAYVSGIGIALLSIGSSYYELQQAIANNVAYLGWYQSSFYNTLFGSGVVMGIWTLILGFHYFFNRMGDSEDKALGEALAEEYARNDREEESQVMPSYERLVDSYDDYDDVYYDEKPKKNGARM